jgi:fibronectin type 3 domain-containing protein
MAPGQIQSVRVPIADSIGKDLILAVRVTNAKDRNSDWSPPLVVTIEQPLAKPVDFKAENVPQGVWLSWTAPNIADFRLYKKGPEQGAPVLFATFADHGYLDSSVDLDKTYEYYVEGFHDKISSEIAGPAAVTPKDSFAPEVPKGLIASNGIGAIELVWERNTEPRFKEYRVYRSEGSGPFTQIAEGLDIPSFSDHNVESGKPYRYRLVAVGQNGMASQPSDPIEAIAP